MKITCFQYGFERYPLGTNVAQMLCLPTKVDTLRKLVGISYGKNTAPVVQIELRQRQRVSFETVPNTCHFHRLGRSFRVFQDPWKARRETYFSRQAQCFQVFSQTNVPKTLCQAIKSELLRVPFEGGEWHLKTHTLAVNIGVFVICAFRHRIRPLTNVAKTQCQAMKS